MNPVTLFSQVRGKAPHRPSEHVLNHVASVMITLSASVVSSSAGDLRRVVNRVINAILARTENIAAEHFGDCRPEAKVIRLYPVQNLIDFIPVHSFHFSSSGIGKERCNKTSSEDVAPRLDKDTFEFIEIRKFLSSGQLS